MTIDKQALREAAEKADSGEWSYEEFNRLDLPGGSFVKIDGRDAVYCLKKPVGGVKQSRAVTAFIAAFNPKVALALRDDMRQAREQLEARAVNLPKRSVGEVMHLSGFSRDYAEGWCAGNDNAIHEIRAAGIKVKES